MSRLAGERILLGVTGGIAAYKAAYLIRRLRDAGAQVRVVMTEAAQAFIAPLTLQALSAQPVRCDLLDPQAEAGMGHIELARWAQRVLVAPASADFMARLAHGLADDLLATLCLATRAPILLAPAMNREMWLNLATQTNVRVLQERGIRLLGPEDGEQACGDLGPGRMLEPDAILEALAHPTPGPLSGVPVLLTAGPTREPLDPVRFIGNRSSGRMGYALAEALVQLDAEVRLVSGPVNLEPPAGVERIQVETALEMERAVMERAADCRIFVAAAAVADYRAAAPATGKIKKDAQTLDLRLVRNPDILAQVAALPQGPFTVGFAAETRRVEEHALDKLRRKGLDMIAANQVGGSEGGFERSDNALTVLWPGGRRELRLAPKGELARHLAAIIVERYHAHHTTEDSGSPVGL
jgi:phosphopantothenoylcysteine decarboxylase/phosphopantothenate--cysteine ligase